jgi:nucleoside-diphosphate-sugar epimerase
MTDGHATWSQGGNRAGRPLLAAVPRDNLCARIIETAGSGIVADPADAGDFVAKARQLLDDQHPAMPEDGYGWEKLFSERMCRYHQPALGKSCLCAAPRADAPSPRHAAPVR